MQPGHLGYVPARIAILPCQAWPNPSRYQSLPLTNTTKEVQDSICKAFNDYVLKGFSAQPYMRGYSPNGVQKALAASEESISTDELTSSWTHLAADCNQCDDFISFYRQSIEPRENWIAFLSKFSKAVHNSDAILLPLLMHSYERKRNDRGLLIAERSAGVAMMLIDTTTGNLLWAGARNALVPNKVLEDRTSLQNISFPDWQSSYDRLFIEDLWASFPGRQVF